MIKKITAFNLVEEIGTEFTAAVTAVYKTSINLMIHSQVYSLKTPLDFTLNELEVGDIIDVETRVTGEDYRRPQLVIMKLKKDIK